MRPYASLAAATLLALALASAYTGVAGLLVPLRLECPGGAGTVYLLNGSRLVVSFVHSVHLTPERDVLAVTSRGFYLVEVWAEDLGAGVPSSPAELGGGVAVEGPLVAYTGVWAWRGTRLLLDLGNALNMTVELPGLRLTAGSCPRLLLELGR